MIEVQDLHKRFAAPRRGAPAVQALTPCAQAPERPVWSNTDDQKPWWEAPYDDWAPEPPVGDGVIDPKD